MQTVLGFVSRSACAAAAVTALVVFFGTTEARALLLLLKTADVERALTLARWPTTDAERARFHERYTFTVSGPTFEYFAVQRVEVITEFRRLELIAEEHARLNDLFGRGGLADVEEALRPWRGRLSIVVHLTFDPSKYITGVPTVSPALVGRTIVVPIQISRSGVYGGGDQPVLIGARVDAQFDAPSVGHTIRPLLVHRDGKEIARVTIDFTKLE
jgi:hypothetical protein